MLYPLLQQRAQANNPIRVGLVGAGKFGAGLVAQVAAMEGMTIAAIAEANIDRALTAYSASNAPVDAVARPRNLDQLEDSIRASQAAVVEDSTLLSQSAHIDVIVEATGIPEIGAAIAYQAIAANKHVVMVNVEADVTVGPILSRLAHNAGVVYTLVDGDQPGCTMNLIDWARTLGFEVVAAGRGTVFFADDRAGTPDTVPQRFGFDEATLKRRSINLKMYNSFRDGTKAQIEMTALANMSGLVPDRRGMHEPSANLADIPKLFSLATEGGLLNQSGVVELANSVASDGRTPLEDPLGMGVFAVIRTDHPFTQEDLKAYHLHPGGDGKNYLLQRPYHLVAVEAPISIAKAALLGQPTGTPLHTPVAEAVCTAKKNLKAGEILDGGGGYTVNGLCEKAAIAQNERLLPLGLSSGAKLKTDIAQGETIALNQVELDQSTFVYKLRQIQDATT